MPLFIAKPAKVPVADRIPTGVAEEPEDKVSIPLFTILGCEQAQHKPRGTDLIPPVNWDKPGADRERFLDLCAHASSSLLIQAPWIFSWYSEDKERAKDLIRIGAEAYCHAQHPESYDVANVSQPQNLVLSQVKSIALHMLSILLLLQRSRSFRLATPSSTHHLGGKIVIEWRTMGFLKPSSMSATVMSI